MKKLFCLLAVTSLILAGCGKDTEPKKVVLPDVAEVYATDPSETDDGKKKRADVEDTQIVTAVTSDSKENSGDESVNGVSDRNDESSAASSSDDPEISDSTAASSASSKPTTTDTKELYYLEGVVCEVRDGSIMLNEEEYRRVSVSFTDNSLTKDLNPGDTVEITYDGYLMETYPHMAHNADSVKVLKKADKKYKFRRFEREGHEFTILMPEDWLSKEIEYPLDNDFTDWGIRLSPKDASGSLDISWHSAFAIREPFDKLPTKVNGFDVTQYSKKGKWKFYTFDNNFIASNNFFGTDEDETYTDEVKFVLNTIEFI